MVDPSFLWEDHTSLPQWIQTTWSRICSIWRNVNGSYSELAKLKVWGHSPPGCQFCLKILIPTTRLEGESTKDHPHFWHLVQVQRFPTLLSVFIFAIKTQNSRKAIVFKVTFIIGNIYRWKVSQRKPCIEQSLEGLHCAQDVSPSQHQCETICIVYCQSGKFHLSFDFGVFIGAPLHRHDLLINCRGAWLKALLLSPMVGFSGMATLHLKTIRCCWPSYGSYNQRMA